MYTFILHNGYCLILYEFSCWQKDAPGAGFDHHVGMQPKVSWGTLWYLHSLPNMSCQFGPQNYDHALGRRPSILIEKLSVDLYQSGISKKPIPRPVPTRCASASSPAWCEWCEESQWSERPSRWRHPAVPDVQRPAVQWLVVSIANKNRQIDSSSQMNN